MRAAPLLAALTLFAATPAAFAAPKPAPKPQNQTPPKPSEMLSEEQLFAQLAKAESAEDEENSELNGRSDLGARIVTPLIQSLQDEVMTRLDAISIEDLCQRARSAGVDCGGRSSADFTI